MPSPPTIDGTDSFHASSTNVITNPGLTTSSSDDVILVQVTANIVTTTAISVSSVTSTSSLSFTRRFRSPTIWTGMGGGAPTNGCVIEEWWTHAASALTGEQITVTFSGNFDNAAMVVCGVSGANTSTPFDANAALPAISSYAGTPEVAMSTTTVNDFLFMVSGAAAVSAATQRNSGTQGAAFTFIDANFNTVPNNDVAVGAAYSTSASAVTNLLSNWPVSSNAVGAVLISDALTPSGGSPPTLDGHANNQAFFASSGTVTLTTSLTNDIIIVGVTLEDLTTSPPTVTGISGGGLTWTRRKQVQFTGGTTHQCLTLETWSASASSALTAAVITVSFSGSVDGASLVAFGVNGANTFDANASLPATAAGLGGATPTPSDTFSTTSLNTLALATIASGINQSGLNTSFPSGYTAVGHDGGVLGTYVVQIGESYDTYATAQTNATVNWGASLTGALGPYHMLIDALVPGGAAPSASSPIFGPFGANPATVGMAALGWIIGRREKLRNLIG